jgi:hypothetical protein
VNQAQKDARISAPSNAEKIHAQTQLSFSFWKIFTTFAYPIRIENDQQIENDYHSPSQAFTAFRGGGS